MFSALVLVLLLGAACAPPPLSPNSEDLQQFERFIRIHAKSYVSTAERTKKFDVFVENLRLAEERSAIEGGTAEFGWNEFSDMTSEEFKRAYLMDPALLKSTRPNTTRFVPSLAYDRPNLPSSFDWRDHNAVSDVKNQGNCGSCWAFSVTGNVESVYAVRRGALISLSEQQLVDCAADTEGCHGGWPIRALGDVEQMGGLERESDYKYRYTKHTCHLNKREIAVDIDDAVSLSSDEQQIADYLVKHGAISVVFNAGDSIRMYRGGIIQISNEHCDPAQTDHAVLLVGYGSENGIPYWIVKNSWGASWGEKGYFRIYRGGNTCGIAGNAVSAVIN